MRDYSKIKYWSGLWRDSEGTKHRVYKINDEVETPCGLNPPTYEVTWAGYFTGRSEWTCDKCIRPVVNGLTFTPPEFLLT